MMRVNYTTLRDEIASRLAAHVGQDDLSIFVQVRPEPTDAECRDLLSQYRTELAAQISARLEAEAVYAGTHRLWLQTATQRDDLRETVAHQRESIISLRKRLADAVTMAAANARAMEAAACFSGRLRGLLLAVDAFLGDTDGADPDVVCTIPRWLARDVRAAAAELANDTTGRVEKSDNDNKETQR